MLPAGFEPAIPAKTARPLVAVYAQYVTAVNVPLRKSEQLSLRHLLPPYHIPACFPYNSVSQTFFKWGPLSLVRMFYGPPYSWDYQTH